MSPEVQAMMVTLGALLGFAAKRVPWINNNAIPFLILAFQYVGALLSGGGFLPDASAGSTQFITAGWVSTVFDPFKVAFLYTAINVFLHQAQKAIRRLPWVYTTTTTAAKKK